jgi:hypothetical protein
VVLAVTIYYTSGDLSDQGDPGRSLDRSVKTSRKIFQAGRERCASMQSNFSSSAGHLYCPLSLKNYTNTALAPIQVGAATAAVVHKAHAESNSQIAIRSNVSGASVNL